MYLHTRYKMAQSNIPIISNLKFLLFTLKLIGQACARIISNDRLEPTKMNTTLFLFLDTLLIAIIVILTAIEYIAMVDKFTWIMFVTLVYLSLNGLKSICYNYRRFAQQNLVLDIWQELVDIGKDFNDYQIKFEVKYHNFNCILLIVTQIIIRIVYLAMLFLSSNNSLVSILDTIRYFFIKMTNIPVIIIVTEYWTYCAILREFFLNINSSFIKLISEKQTRGTVDVTRIILLKTLHKRVCYVCTDITKLMSCIIVLIVIDCVFIITIHVQNLISKLYSGKIINIWFCEYQYSVIWVVEFVITFILIVMPAHLVTKSVSSQ